MSRTPTAVKIEYDLHYSSLCDYDLYIAGSFAMVEGVNVVYPYHEMRVFVFKGNTLIIQIFKQSGTDELIAKRFEPTAYE